MSKRALKGRRVTHYSLPVTHYFPFYQPRQFFHARAGYLVASGLAAFFLSFFSFCFEHKINMCLSVLYYDYDKDDII